MGQRGVQSICHDWISTHDTRAVVIVRVEEFFDVSFKTKQVFKVSAFGSVVCLDPEV